MLYDEDLNPLQRGPRKVERLCGEEEQPRSGRAAAAVRALPKSGASCDESPIIRTKQKSLPMGGSFAL